MACALTNVALEPGDTCDAPRLAGDAWEFHSSPITCGTRGSHPQPGTPSPIARGLDPDGHRQRRKTFTAVNFAYRLVKHARLAVLFLVDRNNLGRQTFKEFDQFITPDDGRKFTELYNVQHLQSNLLDDVSKVHITTIQRLYSMLSGEPDFDPANEFAVGERRAP
jgi:hypothetical protein